MLICVPIDTLRWSEANLLVFVWIRDLERLRKVLLRRRGAYDSPLMALKIRNFCLKINFFDGKCSHHNEKFQGRAFYNHKLWGYIHAQTLFHMIVWPSLIIYMTSQCLHDENRAPCCSKPILRACKMESKSWFLKKICLILRKNDDVTNLEMDMSKGSSGVPFGHIFFSKCVFFLSKRRREIPNTAFESWDRVLSENKIFEDRRIFYRRRIFYQLPLVDQNHRIN